jgi:hypothetical protein
MTVDRLRAEMARFDFIELLYQLNFRLRRIQSAVDEYPEARAVLFLVLEHLDRLRQFNQETGYSVAEEFSFAPAPGCETLPNL